MTAAQSPMAADDPRHGTVNGYVNRRCRCDRCRKAWSIYQRGKPWGLRYRRRMGMKPQKHGRTHGLRCTYVHGCRCSECTEAERVYMRDYRARKSA